VVRGALFKRIEEEKGLGGWALAPRRGIQTVGITDSAIMRVLGFPDPHTAAGAGRDGGRGGAAGTERVMAASRQVSYQWRLREVMAAAGLFNASDLEPLLADRGITLSSVQVWRLVTQTPERLSLPVLAALCDIFDVTPAQLIATRAENVPASSRTASSGGGKDGVTDLNALRPARAKLRPGP
jgi:hypothetical protein